MNRGSGDSAPDWLPDELDHAGRENLDALHVARYDDKEDASADAEVALLIARGLGKNSTVIDLGAGTGQFALVAAAHCERVIAVDISPVMLNHLRSKVVAAGVTNVECVHAGFLSYQHHGPAVDYVYSRWALHHLADAWKAMALHRMRTHLTPGGVLRLSDIVYSFDPPEMETRVERWCATLPVQATTDGEWVRADIEEHVRDEHSTFTWLLEPMIERAGFTIETCVYSDGGFVADYVARAH